LECAALAEIPGNSATPRRKLKSSTGTFKVAHTAILLMVALSYRIEIASTMMKRTCNSSLEIEETDTKNELARQAGPELFPPNAIHNCDNWTRWTAMVAHFFTTWPGGYISDCHTV
jgi:hypothetical protein